MKRNLLVVTLMILVFGGLLCCVIIFHNNRLRDIDEKIERERTAVPRSR